MHSHWKLRINEHKQLSECTHFFAPLLEISFLELKKIYI